MDAAETAIQYDLLGLIKNYIYYYHDEDTNIDHEIPTLKNIDLREFKKDPNSNQFSNEEWNDDFLELTVSNSWAFSLSFNHIINNYL